MKYLFVLFFVLIAGCSTPTTPAPYSPGGEYYVAPGTFEGTLVTTYVTGSNLAINDTNSCTVVINEADSILVGTLTNDSNNAAFDVRGTHDNGPFIDVNGTVTHAYLTTSVDNVGDTLIVNLGFTDDGNTFYYSGVNHGAYLNINCLRK
jgi:hypothetical protein